MHFVTVQGSVNRTTPNAIGDMFDDRLMWFAVDEQSGSNAMRAARNSAYAAGMSVVRDAWINVYSEQSIRSMEV